MNVLVLKTTQDDKHERTISSFNTNDLALINLYGTMRACVGDSNVRLAVAEMIDDSGHVVKCERFERPAEVKTPESEASE
jgi:hypothetical protein